MAIDPDLQHLFRAVARSTVLFWIARSLGLSLIVPSAARSFGRDGSLSGGSIFEKGGACRAITPSIASSLGRRRLRRRSGDRPRCFFSHCTQKATTSSHFTLHKYISRNIKQTQHTGK